MLELQLAGNGPNVGVKVQVDPNYDAVRASLRPTDWQNDQAGAGGHYSIGMMTGLMAAAIASAAQVFQVRWASPNKQFVLEYLTVQFSTATGFAATTVGAPVELIVGHGSTANGSGGAAATMNSIGQKLNPSMASSDFAAGGEIRIATTAALTAATGQTLEANAISACMGADNRTLVSTPPFDLWGVRDAGAHPLVLGGGDSFAIRTVSPAATGTWYMSVKMGWLETLKY